MTREEKERLIKKDIESIENRVRHAFNQGYEMGMKENKEQGDDKELDFVPEHKKIPCTMIIGKSCDDAISRQAVLDTIGNVPDYDDGMVWEALSHAQRDVALLPSATPQQRTGRWIQKEEEDDAEPFIIWECSECHCVDEDGKPSYKYCPQCGAKMEVEE